MALKTRTSLGGRTKKFSHKRVSTALDQLSVAELVSVLQENEYLFKHVLVQDTAYQSLLRNDRRRLHGAIGQTLEKTYGRRANEFAAELAHHFFEAGDDEKTLFYAALAGDDAARVFAHPEATGFYELACDILEQRLDSVEGRRQFVDLTVKLVAVSLRTHGPAKSIERLSQAEDLLRDLQTEMQDRERLARVLFWMGDAYSHQNQQQQAVAYLQQVLTVTQEGITDETLLAIPANVIGRALAAQGKFDQAEPLLAQAAPLLEKSANWYEWVLSVCFLGFARAAQGDTQAGLAETARAIASKPALYFLNPGMPKSKWSARVSCGVMDGMNLSTQLSQLERAQLVRSLDDQMLAYLFKHVFYIADHAGSDEMRELFLKQPMVQKLIPLMETTGL